MRKGFTLVELVLVISIITLIASALLAGLNAVRIRGNDSKVKAQLDSVRKAAILYYDVHGTYGDLTDACRGPAVDAEGYIGINFFEDINTGMRAATDTGVYPTGSIITCRSNGQAYAMTVTLPSSGRPWCIDSGGASKQVPTGLALGDVICN